MYCIGTDEAGYGPRLGPLVISAAVWQLPDTLLLEQMYQRLSHLIQPRPSRGRPCPGSKGSDAVPQAMHSATSDRSPQKPAEDQQAQDGFCSVRSGSLSVRSATPSRSWSKDGLPLVVADSKLLYDRQKGPASLEPTVLTLLAVAGQQVHDWTSLLRQVAFDPASHESALAWYPQHWPRVPQISLPEEILGLAERLQAALAEEGIRVLGLRSLLLFPERFNQLLSHYGNKATLLSCQTLQLVKGLLAQLPPGPVQVVCDKHGGRDQYENLLIQAFFPSESAHPWPSTGRRANRTKTRPGGPSLFQVHPVQIVRQSRQESIYHIRAEHREITFRFICRGEALLPVALASMLSKYLRELAMEAWNRFWVALAPGIRPTAGYPQDARRFRSQIAAQQAELGIPDSAIWRNR